MTDDQLLLSLRAALRPEPVVLDDPHPETMRRLRMAVAEKFGPFEAPALARPRRSNAVRRLGAIVGALSLASAGGAALAVAQDQVPGPLRGIARDLGLPVATADVAATQHAAHKLNDAIATGDTGKVAQALNSLDAHLAKLDAGERTDVNVDDVRNRATDVLSSPSAGGHQNSAPSDTGSGGGSKPAPASGASAGHAGDNGGSGTPSTPDQAVTTADQPATGQNGATGGGSSSGPSSSSGSSGSSGSSSGPSGSSGSSSGSSGSSSGSSGSSVSSSGSGSSNTTTSTAFAKNHP